MKTVQEMLAKSIQNPKENPYLDWIKSGKKQYEGRLKNKIEEWKLEIGKEIKFFDEKNLDNWVIVKITSLKTYEDFGEAFDDLGEKLIPGRTRKEIIEMYNQLFHYLSEESSKMIKDHGVVAIGFEIAKDK